MTEKTDIPSINIFSIGYEGKPIQAFIDMLKQNGIMRLMDVRQAHGPSCATKRITGSATANSSRNGWKVTGSR